MKKVEPRFKKRDKVKAKWGTMKFEGLVAFRYYLPYYETYDYIIETNEGEHTGKILEINVEPRD